MRNVATRYDEPRQAALVRRPSLPAVAFSLSDAMFNAPRGEEEEEAVAGRLEIRVVDATGGATIVQTSADREPLQSDHLSPCPLFNSYLMKQCVTCGNLNFSEKLTNGTAGSPASPNPGPEEPSIYYDATENRPNANAALQKESTGATVASTTTTLQNALATQRDKEKDTSNRAYIAYSKIPIPVKSPRCSLSESTPETNNPNTKAATGSEIDKSPVPATTAAKEKENS